MGHLLLERFLFFLGRTLLVLLSPASINRKPTKPACAWEALKRGVGGMGGGFLPYLTRFPDPTPVSQPLRS